MAWVKPTVRKTLRHDSLPPRTRGVSYPLQEAEHVLRPTPAYAGSMFGGRSARIVLRAYPRVRGEY